MGAFQIVAPVVHEVDNGGKGRWFEGVHYITVYPLTATSVGCAVTASRAVFDKG